VNGFRYGDRVRVTAPEDLAGVMGTVAGPSRLPGQVEVRVEIAGFYGEECPFPTVDLELVHAREGGAR
jgi:hypothetical protein